MERYIVGLGEALWDLLPEGAKLGGAPANFAYHAGQFGHASMAVSALGNDARGDQTIRALEEKGLRYIMPRVDYPTGTVGVRLDADGVPTYDIKTNVAWDNIPFTPEIEAVAKQCSAVCFGSLAQRSDVSRKTIGQFLEATADDCLKIFDINLRGDFYTGEIISESMRRANILKINDEELVIVGKMFNIPALSMEDKCRHLLDTYELDLLVLTCGTQGSYVFTPGGRSFRETPKIQVVDTVGAGDSFTGSFVAALLSGMSVARAHELAVDVSAFVCTQGGAMPQLPAELMARAKG